MTSHAGPQADRKAAQEQEKQEIERLFQTWKQNGDAESREKIICQHLYLVQAVARKFTGLGESPEDLTSEGVMGLINAVDLFDPKRGVQFATYATHLIDGQIRHYLRDKSKLIREPAWIQERLTRIARAAEAMTHEMGRPATLAQIAQAVDLTEKQVREALKAQQRSRVASLDTSRSRDSDEGDFKFEAERLLVPLAGEAGLDVEDRLFLEQAMSRLKPLEQKVLYHFYYLDLNQTEIARKLGISVNYASYLLRGALTKLKKAFEAQSKITLQTSPSGIFERRCQGASALYSVSPPSPTADSEEGKSPEVYFRQALSQEVLRAGRYPQQFALLYMEPDGAADLGDEEVSSAMQELVLRTRKAVRMVDVVAQLGRWRIGLLLPHTGR
ncbi:MAG: sigma-70 family RNA polymerase sigma factor, partial [Armatimonadetes bacterium]|nr:sigma-70 family RNA polymerase sigma factor [Armatimonadota bacterium]NIO74858.1 sigma-70 family RNA polymerase sigma factor [Armatimonadota bacterium]NIO95620.1 sigma-70 family RNA polymerase sigma factor [Armatimonadota bacterium]